MVDIGKPRREREVPAPIQVPQTLPAPKPVTPSEPEKVPTGAK
jgi:hypothetical protein